MDVALQGSQVFVAAFAHQQWQGDVVVGEGGQGRVPQLVQGQPGAADPSGVALEQVFGAFVGQSSSSGGGADVQGCGRVRGGARRETAARSGARR